MVTSFRVRLVLGLLLLWCLHFGVGQHIASALQSSNYRFDESSVGNNGFIQSSSANFTANGTTGVLGTGEAASSNYQVIAGPLTSHDPTLTVRVNSSTADFGAFSPTTTSTSTASFSVLNYTSFGYVVQITGNEPTNGAHTIPGMTTTGPPQIGIEQFGMNLVANTIPTSLGANPDNGGFGFGQATTNYSTPNEYRFINGETIAQAPKSSGETNYTLSYIINVANLTPGGQYSSSQTLVVTGTY